MRLRKLVKMLIPPVFFQASRSTNEDRKNNSSMSELNHLEGDYSSWSDALKVSTGYDRENILEKTKEALLKVKQGDAVFERDSVLFYEVQYNWQLLTGLMWAAARNHGELDILDFGGSLGSTYFQNRAFLSGLRSVRWNIVEQPRHVEIGKACFEDTQLKFYKHIKDCTAETEPQAILLSGVLQVLEEPYKILDELSMLQCNTLIIDRTPFWEGSVDRLCVQHVPERIYEASYPSWIFSESGFQARLNKKWDVVAKFPGLDKLPGPVRINHLGVIAISRRTS